MNKEGGPKMVPKIQTAIVVGASGGIGMPIAQTLHQAGLNVVLAARNREKLDAVVMSLDDQQRALVVPTDASSLASVQRLFNEAARKFGSVDAVVISTGRWSEDETELRQGIVLPTENVASVAAKVFYAQQSGLIANISSWVVDHPELPGNNNYRAAKITAEQILDGVRDRFASWRIPNVRVTHLRPATVDTSENHKKRPEIKSEKWAKAVQPKAIAIWLLDHLDDPNIPRSHFFPSGLVL